MACANVSPQWPFCKRKLDGGINVTKGNQTKSAAFDISKLSIGVYTGIESQSLFTRLT